MREKIKDFLTDLYEDHLFTCFGCFFFLVAILLFLGFKVHENFLVYPLIAIGAVAILIALIVLGPMGLLAIPILGLPIAVILWLALSIMELIPMISVGVFVVLGILSLLIQKYNN